MFDVAFVAAVHAVQINIALFDIDAVLPALVLCRSQSGFAQSSGGSNEDGFPFSVKLAFRDRRQESPRSMAQDFLQCVGGNGAVPVVKRIQLLICIDDFVNRSFVVYDLKICPRQQQRRRKQSQE